MPAAKAAPAPLIESCILLIRGKKVMLDSDLAKLYQVETGALNQAVSRNRDRFPADFMFRLSREEADILRSQFVISSANPENLRSRFAASSSKPQNLRSQTVISSFTDNHGGRRYLPYAFTEQGIAMLSSVLKSKRAIDVNIAIMRTFVRLRQLLATHEELARRLEQLEWRQSEQDQQIRAVFDAIQHLIEAPPDETKRRIGFPTSKVELSV